jgi:hypothetical protein
VYSKSDVKVATVKLTAFTAQRPGKPWCRLNFLGQILPGLNLSHSDLGERLTLLVVLLSSL